MKEGIIQGRFPRTENLEFPPIVRPPPSSPENRCPLAQPDIERGSLPQLSKSTHQRVHHNSKMAVIRSRAAFAERCPRPKSYRPLLRRHRSSRLQRSTADIPAHDFVLGSATHWSHTTPACRHRSSPRT